MNKLIILVPGIMGSNLAYGSYQVWPRFFPSNIGVYEKYLPLKSGYSIDPAGLVSHSYKKAYDYLSQMEGIDLERFDYDWRISNLTNVEKFHEFILRLHDGYEEINIVAHSMGGLISRLLLNKYHGEIYINKIKNFITLGTPWHGALDAYKTITYGKNIPDTFPHSIVLTKSKSKIISKGFPSVYQLFPDDEYERRLRNEYDLPILREHDEEINHRQIFDTDDIVTYINEINYEYGSLIEEFRNELATASNNTSHIVHHEIVGVGVTTLTSIEVNNRNEVMAHFKNGDGTVPDFSAKSNFANRRYYVRNAKHEKLVKDPNSLELMEKIILNHPIEETDSIFTNERNVKDIGFVSKIVRIACPVEITILKDGRSIYGYSDSFEYGELNEIIENNLSIFSLGNTVYLIMNNEEDVLDDEIVIEAYDEGATSISVEQYNKGKIEKSVAFKTFNINPTMRAKLNITQEIEQTKLKIKDKDDIEIIEDPIEIEEELELPKTISAFESEYSFESQELKVFVGECSINVIEVREGTYNVSETYLNINGKSQALALNGKNEVIFEEGENRVKIFSVDAYGNEEESDEFTVYYLKHINPEITIEVLPHQYKINVENNKSLMDLVTSFDLPIPSTSFEVSNEENVFPVNDTVTVINQNPVIRTINIIYDCFLGQESVLLTIDEFAIASIFDGVANANNLHDLLEGLGMHYQPQEIKMTKLEGMGIYRKITDKNLNNSKRIFVRSLNRSLEIIKKSDYILSFHNLKEDIKVDQEDIYNFSFKIFNRGNEEIRSIEIEAFLKISIENEDFITNDEDISIDFNQATDLYEGSFNIAIIREILDGYWDNTQIHSAELVITKRGATSNIIRTKELKVRRN